MVVSRFLLRIPGEPSDGSEAGRTQQPEREGSSKWMSVGSITTPDFEAQGGT